MYINSQQADLHWQTFRMSSSTPLFFIITLFISLQVSSAFRVLNTFYDTVHALEVKYYTLESTSPVVLALYSVEGDADIYGSPTSKNSKPSSESFDYMSASCGLDVIVLPMSESLRRVSVGIYGHVRHENTTYQVWVVEPEEEDVLRYQVCGFNTYSDLIAYCCLEYIALGIGPLL